MATKCLLGPRDDQGHFWANFGDPPETAKYTTVCNSGTAALHIAFNSIKLSKNDVVLMPAITFIASYSMAKFFGAKVYLVDIDPHTGQITPDTIENCIIRNNLKSIKCSVNCNYINSFQTKVTNKDELAFFPPVTGG